MRYVSLPWLSTDGLAERRKYAEVSPAVIASPGYYRLHG